MCEAPRDGLPEALMKFSDGTYTHYAKVVTTPTSELDPECLEWV